MKIPLRFKLIAAAAVVLLIFYLSSSVSGVLTMLAVVLWAAAASVLLQVSGLATAGRIGWLGARLAPLLAPGTRRGVASGAAAQAPASRPASPAVKQVDLVGDPRKALARGRAQLAAMVGDDPARIEIADRIVPQAEAFAKSKKPLLGAARALVVVISGPRGVGKSVVARALADLLFGLGVVRMPVLSEVPAPSGSRLAPEWPELLEPALDGVALVDNAAWLLQAHPLTGSLHADGFCEAVVQVANAHSGKLALILTLQDRELEALQGRPAFKDLARKLTLRHLAMAPIEPQDLVQVLRAQLAKHNLRCAEALNEPLRRLVKRHADVDGFDHAEAMRRVSEFLLETHPGVESREVTLEELEQAFEAKV